MEPFWALFNNSVFWGVMALFWGLTLGGFIQNFLEKPIPGPFSSDQPKNYAGCRIIVTIIIVIVVTVLTQIFLVPEAAASLGVFEQMAIAILGILTSLALVFSLGYGSKIQNKVLKFLYTGAMIIAGLALAAIIVLIFIKIELPFSVNFFWIPIGLPVLLMLGHSIIDKASETFGRNVRIRRIESPSSLDNWVNIVEICMLPEGVFLIPSHFDHHQEMIDARDALQRGALDIALQNPEFFNFTESILRNLVIYREIIVQHEDVYQAMDEVLRTVQAVYLYAVEQFPQYDKDPVLKKVMKS